MDSNNVVAIRSVITLSAILLCGLVWFALVRAFHRKKSLVYLLFFTIFYVYVVKVLDYTLLQFQSLLLLKQFVPDLILEGQTAESSVNLLPLIGLTPGDVTTSLQNVLLLIPFGFGLPFVTNLRLGKVVAVGALFSIAIELLQWVTGVLAGITFRIADVNDVIFNTAGVAIGYVVFVGFVRVCRHLARTREAGANPILRYIAGRPQIEQ